MTKYLKGECRLCGGHIEFPAEAIGSTADCPHCGKPTELLLAAPAEVSTVPKKTIVYTGIALGILVVGLVSAIVAVKVAPVLAKRRAGQNSNPAPVAVTPTNPDSPRSAKSASPFADISFWASPVTLEKLTNSSRAYAVGTIRNLTNHQRFGVTVQLDIFDANGRQLNGENNRPSDYQAVIEVRGEWRYNAPVLDKKAVSAKLVSIKEQN